MKFNIRDWMFANILTKLDSIERKVVKLMAVEDDILAKVTAESTVIASIATLVAELKANASDPVKLQAIVNALDANDIALAAIANTGTPTP